MSCMSYNAVWELNTRLVRWPRLIYKEFETTCPTGTSENMAQSLSNRVEELGVDIHLPSAALRNEGRMWKGRVG